MNQTSFPDIKANKGPPFFKHTLAITEKQGWQETALTFVIFLALFVLYSSYFSKS